MEKQQIIEFIKQQLLIQTGEKDFDIEKTFNDQGIDSLDAIELVISCEKQFEVHIKDESYDQFTTPLGLAIIIMKELEFKST